MFSIHDIEGQVAVFNETAQTLYERAEAPCTTELARPLLRCSADAFQVAAKSLERMIDRVTEREFRDAMDRSR
jgi:hypothetical protein